VFYGGQKESGGQLGNCLERVGRKYGLLLCVGVTKDELALAKTEGSDAVLPELKDSGVFPYTVFDRESVLKGKVK
jgi:hypothetical protein